jgi:hypothetical protein
VAEKSCLVDKGGTTSAAVRTKRAACGDVLLREQRYVVARHSIINQGLLRRGAAPLCQRESSTEPLQGDRAARAEVVTTPSANHDFHTPNKQSCQLTICQTASCCATRTAWGMDGCGRGDVRTRTIWPRGDFRNTAPSIVQLDDCPLNHRVLHFNSVSSSYRLLSPRRYPHSAVGHESSL